MPDFNIGSEPFEYVGQPFVSRQQRRAETRKTAGALAGLTAQSYVKTADAWAAVPGRESELVRNAGIPWTGRDDHINCPYHDHDDHNPSWRLMPDGRAVCSCRQPHSIFDVIMFKLGCDFEAAKIWAMQQIGRADLIVDVSESSGLTLAQYAEYKALPIAFLQQRCGLQNAPRFEKYHKPAIVIPYRMPDGTVSGTRFRFALTGKKRFVWKTGSKLCLYGAHFIAGMPTSFVVLVEGESDAQTLWYYNIQALGVPGSPGGWNEECDAPLVAKFAAIYVVIEPDSGGDALLARLAQSSIAPRLRIIRLPPGIKDPSALHVADPDNFQSVFQQALSEAQPLTAEQLAAATKSDTQDEPRGLDKIIDTFNARYAVVNEAGKAVVYERVRDPSLGRDVIVRIQFADLKKLYAHRLFSLQIKGGGEITKSEADWWLNHQRRRTYLDGVTFDPTGQAPSTFWNLWNGFAVEPAPGDWGLMREHIRRVICAGNEKHFDYVIGWLARMFQHPAEPGEVALVIRGKKGAGKGVFLAIVTHAWGAHGIHIRDSKHLVGNFNAHLRDCICLYADEAFFAGDRQHEGALKGLITERTLPIEGKGQNLVTAPNMLHVVMSSNSDWIVPASHDERRYAVFDAADIKIGDRSYFANIMEQLENGGLAAMIYDLLQHDISQFEVRDIPASSALTDQKRHSLDTLDRWWMNVLERGFVFRSQYGLKAFDEWFEFISTELLNRSYLQWCADSRVTRPKSRIQLGERMTDLYSKQRPDGSNIIGEVERPLPGHADDLIERRTRTNGYLVGALDDARKSFVAKRGAEGEWK